MLTFSMHLAQFVLHPPNSAAAADEDGCEKPFAEGVAKADASAARAAETSITAKGDAFP